MCGICGYITNGSPDLRVLQHMMRPLRARGPDDEGTFLDGSAALGHRRLCVIDLESGRQPLSNEDGSVQVVFNGEIYNYRELRRRLEQQGHRFRTQTDGEVIAHLYEEQADSFVAQLNGMFALAVWDARRQRLLLARDRMGQKPLYWAQLPRGFVFASELKSLLEHPEIERQLLLPSVARFLLHGYIPSPWTIFRNVYKLNRAECLTYANHEVRRWAWWQPPNERAQPLPSFHEAAEEFWQRLRCSVQRHLVSDVPLGVFLSGGIDSSSLVACMRETCAPDQIKTFCIGFDDPSCDESAAARRAAAHFDTDHQETVFTSRELLDVLPEVYDYLDEPFADSSVLPTYLLSRFARRSVTVALGGDGGDELLAGYPTFVVHQPMKMLERYFPGALSVLGMLLRRLPVRHRHMGIDFLLRQLLRGRGKETPLAHQVWMGALAPQEQAGIFHESAQAELDHFDLTAELNDRFAHCRGPDELGRLLDFYAQTYLQEGVLAKVDRASMAHGLEVRSPFLDPEVVEYVAALPAKYKRKGLCTKRLLRKAAMGRLPTAIIRRVKHGFGIPFASWLAGPLQALAGDLLSPARLAEQGLFHPQRVTQLFEEHVARRANHGRALWNLLAFQAWYERWAKAPLRPERDGSVCRLPLEPSESQPAVHTADASEPPQPVSLPVTVS